VEAIVAVGVVNTGVDDGLVAVGGGSVASSSDGVSVDDGDTVSSGGGVAEASVGAAGVSVGALQARMLAKIPIRASPIRA